VVDDRSEDRTGALARAVPAGRARRVEVVDGEPLHEGWLGKPWACHQGARVAEGTVLVFTDADTVHAPDLLARAVAGLEEERADLLTLVGRQRMDTFWERLVQPHVFLAMLFRFPDFERVAANDRWRDAIANGQYIMMPRASYARIHGHGAVRDEVVEDLALAQVVKRSGGRLRVRSAEDGLETRMYRSLAEIVEGWAKNLALGGMQSFPPGLRPFVAPLSLVLGVSMWLLPPVLMAGWLFASAFGTSTGGSGPLWPVLAWLDAGAAAPVGLAVTASTWQYAHFTRRMGAPARYGLLYPLGAAVVLFIFARSWARGRRVRWKGRSYRVPAARSRP